MAPAPSSARAILPAAGATERSGASLNSDNCHLFPKVPDVDDGSWRILVDQVRPVIQFGADFVSSAK